ncbi:MAG: hypothetical protein KDJ12_03435 [Hyphomicrobiales bacterium]|nr:hypothetical protein [Hyphomicrobiales bacterium]
MTLEWIALGLSILSGASSLRAPDVASLIAPEYRPAERAVDNWRRQGALNLDLAPERALALALGRDLKGLSRCVRLNNYWCVKKAGWTGEIAADNEGHVAFATAAEGAAGAAQLLRRYYIDFGLHSARAIVQRWAPAQCVAPLTYHAPGRRIAGRKLLGPEPKGLTTRGLGSTLRAKWLARHRPGLAPRRRGKGAHRVVGVRRSIVPDRIGAMMKTPTIAAGIGAVEGGASRPPARKTQAPMRLAMLPYPGVAMGTDPRMPASLPPLPTLSCAPETRRILNYATSIASGVAAGPDADLALFDAEGKPTPNFAKALFNMAAVEIGPLRATQALVDSAVATIAARTDAKPKDR